MISLLTRKPDTRHRMLRQRVHRDGARGRRREGERERGREGETWAAGRHSTFNLQPSSFNRGTTLIEVLMSIMILSIGIISLATLFPISVIRALQATQLTNATHLRFNAETIIDTLNGLPTAPTVVNIVHNPDGIDGPDDDRNAFEEHFGRNYIVDPLGVLRADAALKDSFGHDGITPPMPHAQALDRFVGNDNWTGDEAATLQAVSLPDSWVTLYEGVPAASTLFSVEIPAADVSDNVVNLTEITSMSGVRAVLFDKNLRSIEVRDTSSNTLAVDPDTRIISWDAQSSLPDNGNYSPVSQVLLQVQEARYTWLLTVRKAASGPANVDVVVFFRRPGPPEEEQVLTATFTKGNNTVPIPTLDPDMKRGGFILDLSNARWYRILDTSATELTIDRPALENGTAAIIMHSVIEVYPIRTKFQ